ncbi:MAG: Trp family transcriptional regulator [Acidobacteriota bacterium]|jgi:TrpR family trp operon transcriptional repressor|nr:Trp family transcriptional regulator [Acidobacteriota bacterium]
MKNRSVSLDELAELLAAINDPDLIRGFLQSLLTPREIVDLAGRWELVKLLDSGWTQREIARELGMSLCKITRGARELRRPDAPFRRVLRLSERLVSLSTDPDRG